MEELSTRLIKPRVALGELNIVLEELDVALIELDIRLEELDMGLGKPCSTLTKREDKT